MSSYQAIECEEVLRHLFAYIDGELQDEQHLRIEEHLHMCRSCFSRAEFERRLKAHLLELGHPTVPPSFEQRIGTLLSRLPTE